MNETIPDKLKRRRRIYDKDRYTREGKETYTGEACA